MYQAVFFVGILLVSSSCYGNMPAFLTNECDANPMSRVSCGENGISEAECVGKGCCFSQETLPNIPRCYTKNPGTCTVFPMNRKECGSSLPEIACKALGCCYEGGLNGIPSCYKKQ